MYRAPLEGARPLPDSPSYALYRPSYNTVMDVAVQRVLALPEHLLVATMSRVPLRHCLLRLPHLFHKSALRAHNPSIDRHQYFRVSRVHMSMMLPTLHAVASLRGLRELCLAGETVPRIPRLVAAVLAGLPLMTALDLSSCGLSSPVVAALSAALPTLRLLESLDVSDNRLRLPTLRGLVRGVSRCPGLRVLRMLRTVNITPTVDGPPAVLARCLTALPRLTELRFGTADHLRRWTDMHGCFCDGVVSMLRTLQAAQDLRHLELGYSNVQVRASERSLQSVRVHTACCKVVMHCAWSLSDGSATRAWVYAGGNASGDIDRCPGAADTTDTPGHAFAWAAVGALLGIIHVWPACSAEVEWWGPEQCAWGHDGSRSARGSAADVLGLGQAV